MRRKREYEPVSCAWACGQWKSEAKAERASSCLISVTQPTPNQLLATATKVDDRKARFMKNAPSKPPKPAFENRIIPTTSSVRVSLVTTEKSA
jgi:hypothetical protein